MQKGCGGGGGDDDDGGGCSCDGSDGDGGVQVCISLHEQEHVDSSAMFSYV